MAASTEKLEEISEQAFVWVLLLENATWEEREEFMAWLRASPSHMREVLRAMEVIDDVDKLVGASKERSGRWPLAGIRWQPLSTYLVAACCAVMIVGAAIAALNLHSPQKLSTAYEWQNKVLSDGTVVQAGPLTELVIDYSRNTRAIRLIRGEAMFEVAKNPNRPFIVTAAHATARAVGTRFAVSTEGGEDAVVTVDEGTVTVKRADDGGGNDRPVTLRAGDEVRVSSGGNLAVHPVDLHASLAWARHRLVFDGQTVIQAVHEFNRRNRVQIVVTDSTLRQRVVFGTFSADDPESFARFLESQAQGATSIVKAADTLVLIPSEGASRPKL